MSIKTILCYGDSLTWGSDPLTALRHPASHRWPEVLQAELGGKVKVVADGLRGRTTAYDSHTADCDRNGARTLPTVLYAQAPVDLVIVMLGTNDLQTHLAGTAIGALQGMRRLAAIVENHFPGPGLDRPKLLIVSPPPLCETGDPFFAGMFDGSIAESEKLSALYGDLANELGVAFFDASKVCNVSPVDGVHMDVDNTAQLGRALVPIARELAFG